MTRLVRPARMEFLGELSEFALQAAQALGLPPSSRPKLELVLEEALTNVIHYAYPAGETGEVAVQCDLEEGPPKRARFQVMDAGQPFDPLRLEPPDLALGLEERKIGGLGVHLTRLMVDAIAYERTGDQNILTFSFAVASAGDQP